MLNCSPSYWEGLVFSTASPFLHRVRPEGIIRRIHQLFGHMGGVHPPHGTTLSSMCTPNLVCSYRFPVVPTLWISPLHFHAILVFALCQSRVPQSNAHEAPSIRKVDKSSHLASLSVVSRSGAGGIPTLKYLLDESVI